MFKIRTWYDRDNFKETSKMFRESSASIVSSVIKVLVTN